MENFVYRQPVEIHFCADAEKELAAVLKQLETKSAVIVCSSSAVTLSQRLMSENSAVKEIYSGVRPDPQLSSCAEALEIMKRHGVDTVIAVGGGSAIDCAKFAAACVYGEQSAYYYFEKRVFPQKTPKIVAIPTTSGTGSEVTKVSVISHNGEKRSIHNDAFMPTACIVCPALTLSVPPKTTMITGLDAFTHAIEAYWSRNHQPITDALAVEAMRLCVNNLRLAYEKPSDIFAREQMSKASLLAGLAFSAAKTGACHACSFAISAHYHLPHGEACAFTLDRLIILNRDSRLDSLSGLLGFESLEKLCEEINSLKRLAGLAISLSDLADEVDTELLASESAAHPLMQNNPVQFTSEQLKKMLDSMK